MVNGWTHHIRAKLHKPAHILWTIWRQRCTLTDLQSQLCENGVICCYFPSHSLSLFFPLMNSSSVRANNRDGSNKWADNGVAILTRVRQSGCWWHLWWDTGSGRRDWQEERRDASVQLLTRLIRKTSSFYFPFLTRLLIKHRVYSPLTCMASFVSGV